MNRPTRYLAFITGIILALVAAVTAHTIIANANPLNSAQAYILGVGTLWLGMFLGGGLCLYAIQTR